VTVTKFRPPGDLNNQMVLPAVSIRAVGLKIGVGEMVGLGVRVGFGVAVGVVVGISIKGVEEGDGAEVGLGVEIVMALVAVSVIAEIAAWDWSVSIGVPTRPSDGGPPNAPVTGVAAVAVTPGVELSSSSAEMVWVVGPVSGSWSTASVLMAAAVSSDGDPKGTPAIKKPMARSSNAKA